MSYYTVTLLDRDECVLASIDSDGFIDALRHADGYIKHHEYFGRASYVQITHNSNVVVWDDWL